MQRQPKPIRQSFMSTHAHQHLTAASSLTEATEQGRRVTKWSFAALTATALLQVLLVSLTGSVALLADTVHNFADAFTALPLWFAFALADRKPSPRFTYGYGRLEDLAGLLIVLVIFASAAATGYESIRRFTHPAAVRHLWVVAGAALVGFAGNELVARFRIRVGKQINSKALVADGHHARIDGLTSLAVLLSALGLRLGYSMADPLIGLLITLAIVRIAWRSGRSVLIRLLDGVDPQTVDEIRRVAAQQDDRVDVGGVRARWLGHRLHAEAKLAVPAELTVAAGHEIAETLRRRVAERISSLAELVVHVDAQKPGSDGHFARTSTGDAKPDDADDR